MNDSEGKAGINPEEVLGTGKRSQIRFQPIVMKKKRSSVRKSSIRRLEKLMNKGVLTKSGARPINRNELNNASPLSQGMSSVLRNQYKTNPSALRNPLRTNFALNMTPQSSGLMETSRSNRTNKKKRRARKKLDYVPF